MREREELRRAVSVAAELCDWRTLGDDAMERASKDLVKLARSGGRALRGDLEDEIATKKAEPRELRRGLRDLAERAERADFAEPLEFTHSYTVRRPASGLVTHTETLELKDSAEALKAVETIEARLPKWTELQKEMLEELRDRDRRLAEASKRLPDFVASAASLVRHVLATLY